MDTVGDDPGLLILADTDNMATAVRTISRQALIHADRLERDNEVGGDRLPIPLADPLGGLLYGHSIGLSGFSSI